jgi:Uma2 family endonuclease
MATTPMIAETAAKADMVAGTPMPLDQYLRTMFHPDREYVDGIAEERIVGEFEHGKIQLWLGSMLMRHQQEWQIDVVVEVRLQVRRDRFRIPDIMVLRAGQEVHRYPKTAPLICIEVLSPEDTWKRLRLVTDDYQEMGVEHVWAFDPMSRDAFLCTVDGFRKVKELVVPGTPIRVEAAEVFSVLKQKDKPRDLRVGGVGSLK